MKSSTKSTPAPKSSTTTEYSRIKKRSGARKPPPTDRKHKQLKPSKPVQRTTYIVTLETIDHHHENHGGLHDDAIIGYGLFKSYEVEEEDGFVTATATCPEGEEMTVTAKEALNKTSLGPKKSSKLTMGKVYYVTRESIEYHNDCRRGIQDTAVVCTFFSREEANQAVRTDLLNNWNVDFFVSYEVEEEDGLVNVTAVCPKGEEMTVTVEEGQLDEGPDEESDESF